MTTSILDHIKSTGLLARITDERMAWGDLEIAMDEMEHASEYARNAIIKYGLSEKCGTRLSVDVMTLVIEIERLRAGVSTDVADVIDMDAIYARAYVQSIHPQAYLHNALWDINATDGRRGWYVFASPGGPRISEAVALDRQTAWVNAAGALELLKSANKEITK